jgi:hypothetical protein
MHHRRYGKARLSPQRTSLVPWWPCRARTGTVVTPTRHRHQTHRHADLGRSAGPAMTAPLHTATLCPSAGVFLPLLGVSHSKTSRADFGLEYIYTMYSRTLFSDEGDGLSTLCSELSDNRGGGDWRRRWLRASLSRHTLAPPTGAPHEVWRQALGGARPIGFGPRLTLRRLPAPLAKCGAVRHIFPFRQARTAPHFAPTEASPVKVWRVSIVGPGWALHRYLLTVWEHRQPVALPLRP